MSIRTLGQGVAFAAAIAVVSCAPSAPPVTQTATPVTQSTPAKEAPVNLPFDPDDANASFTARLEIVANQRPIAGAIVDFGGKTFVSDAEGVVTIESVAVRGTQTGRVSMGGFMPRTFTPSYATSGSKALRVFLFAEGTREKVSAGAGGSVQHGPGKITLPANGVVDGSGNAFTGDISVAMRGTALADFVKVGAGGTPTLAEGVDGDMLPAGFGLAEQEGGALEPVLPIATVQMELSDAAGNPLQLKSGATASLEFTIPAGDGFEAGSDAETIVFDEERQIWTAAGTCNVQVDGERKTCAGTVSHFSTYAIRWRDPNRSEIGKTDFVRCGRYVPSFVASETHSAARLTRILTYIQLQGLKVPVQDVSSDGKLFITPSAQVTADFRFKLQDATGTDVGDELSFPVEGAVLGRAVALTSMRTFTKVDADSLRSVPTAPFNACPRLVVPILLSAAAPPAAPCAGKCNAETELCVETSGICVSTEGTCTPACGANSRCVAGSACACEDGYHPDADGACIPCSACAPGTWVASSCTPVRDTQCTTCTAITDCTNVRCTSATDSVCSECPANKYSSGEDCLDCSPVDGCSASPTCTTATNSQCTACADSFFLVEGVMDACRACTPVTGCQAGALRCSSADDSTCLACDAGLTLQGGIPSTCTAAPASCLENQHVVNNACVACAGGTTRPAGDDPAGPNTSCTSNADTVIDLATASSGSDVLNFAGPSMIRGFEFGVDQTMELRSVTVTGLPPQMASTAKLWHKSGAIDLQTADTYALGTPYAPTSTTSTSATFTFGTPLSLPSGIYSLAVAVEDTGNGFEWGLREFSNTGQYLFAGSLTLGPIWGWLGALNTSTNTAESVQSYGNQTFQVPRIALTIAP